VLPLLVTAPEGMTLLPDFAYFQPPGARSTQKFLPVYVGIFPTKSLLLYFTILSEATRGRICIKFDVAILVNCYKCVCDGLNGVDSVGRGVKVHHFPQTKAVAISTRLALSRSL